MALDEQHTADSGFIESFVSRYPTRILETLLCDRTTGRNIIWADDEYESLGDGYRGDDEITVEKITGLSAGVIKPRIAKEQEHQSRRTKSRAEVFTPSWLCNQMNNDVDSIWFGRRNAFNAEGEQSWKTNEVSVVFPHKKNHGWHAYVLSPRLEITCGEAPFVCSRYDTVTGDVIPVGGRIGFLDRKLRVVSERAKSRREWVRWGLAALKASYGFEYQGDNLLLARINVFETFCEHLRERWGVGISDEELDQAAWVVSWNFWQMDGFNCAVPTNKMGAVAQSSLFDYEVPTPKPMQPTLFNLLDEPSFDDAAKEDRGEGSGETVPLCLIYDWQENKPIEFQAMKGKASGMGKKFYAVIGNPPYQEESRGNNNSDTPIYHLFYDSAFKVADRVELVSPARFLFNAGGTPREWNERMLSDPHIKVEDYRQKSSDVFANTDIKGGVAVLLRDGSRKIGPIGTFTPYPELNRIVKNVWNSQPTSLASIITNRGIYRYSDLAYKEQPEELSKTSDRRIAPSSFERMTSLFTKKMPTDGHEYIRVLGRISNKRVYRWFRKDYVKKVSNLYKYKVIVSKASGTGTFGEVLSPPIIGEPSVAFTETYISIGEVDSRELAEAILKYIKTKFARSMLGVLKVTQNCAKPAWAKVPIQDFTPSSDIDWSQPVPDIDKKLYEKYDLSDDEIDFIESHVKEMD